MCKPPRHILIVSPPSLKLLAAYFYTKDEMGMRMAYWFGFAAIAGAFGGLIAFGIQNVHAEIANWRLLFIVEGVPTVLIGLLAMIILPNRPEETKIFNEKEREIALDRGSRGLKADTGRVVKRGEVHSMKSALCMRSRRPSEHVIAAFKDWRVGVLYIWA